MKSPGDRAASSTASARGVSATTITQPQLAGQAFPSALEGREVRQPGFCLVPVDRQQQDHGETEQVRPWHCQAALA